MREPFLNRVSVSPHYLDLRQASDDKTVLRNPHKGWYHHFIDNGMMRGLYRDWIKADDRLESVPGLNHLYLRIDWSDIEKSEGVYDWSYIDYIFENWSKYYTFSFRLCTYETTNSTATPDFVREAGANGTWVDFRGVKKWEPDYGDPIFLDKLEAFFVEFGRKFNGDPRVEFIDVGTFGVWGEGHTGYGSGRKWSVDVLKKHVNLHIKYFPDTYVLLNDDMAYTAGAFEGPDAANEFIAYCAGKGLGARDDSICVEGHARHNGYDTLRTPFFFDSFWQTAPVDLEFGHVIQTDAASWRDGFPAVEAMRRAHATFAGYHGYHFQWMEKAANMCEFCANRLGYWYFVNGVDLPECISGLKSIARLDIENRGWSVAYHAAALKARVKNEELTAEVADLPGANLRWFGCTEEIMPLDFRNVPAGNYALEIGLFEGGRPIKLALAEDRFDDGWYKLSNIEVKPL